MAKAVEDTTFYQYNRLVSLNEVGGDPQRFGVSLAAFHRENQERARRWPHAMLATSTHDNKRSEDVRARISVLSEMPDEWHRALSRWSKLNREQAPQAGEGGAVRGARPAATTSICCTRPCSASGRSSRRTRLAWGSCANGWRPT